MRLCLLHERDLAGEWIADLSPDLRVVTSRELVEECLFIHEHHGDHTSTSLTLGDGTELASGDVERLWCRLVAIDTELDGFDETDHQYASAEWNATLISWFAELGDRMVNDPAPHALGGRWNTPSQWAMLAADCGLPAVAEGVVVPTGQPDAIVIGGRVFSHGDLPEGIVAALVELTRRVGAGIMGYSSLAGLADRPIRGLVGNPVPDVAATGAAGQAAVRALLGVAA